MFQTPDGAPGEIGGAAHGSRLVACKRYPAAEDLRNVHDIGTAGTRLQRFRKP